MATIPEALAAAFDHHRAGRLTEAGTLYARILDADPEQATAAQLLGVLLAQTGRPADGAAYLRRALVLRPDSAGGLSNLGGVFQTLGDAAAAERAFGRALRLDPALADAHASRAGALRALGRTGEAAASAARALALAPAHAHALVNRADSELALRDAAAAEATARRALAAGAALPAAHMTLGSALAAGKRWDDAEASYRAALALDARFAEAWENLGALLAKRGRFDESLAAFAEAESLRPVPSQRVALWAARGAALIAMARPVEALADLDRALESRPGDSGLRWNRAFARLLAGDCAGGWPEFEWRRHDPSAEPPWRTFPQPVWRGEDPAGRTVLLYAEQGLGDTLQFVRYAPLVAARGARVLLEVQPPLVSLLQGMAGVERVFARGEPLPEFDLECPLMSLPLAFGTDLATIPADVPYLGTKAGSADSRKGGGEKGDALTVGLVWAGNPGHANDRNRSIPAERLRPLLAIPGVRFVSLQTGDARAAMPGEGVRDVMDGVRDFADTAAILNNLDLVIAVDTATVHLAGALGVPAWLLLPFAPDWRWLLDRNDSPWYPSLRLFRQPRPGDWDSVVEAVAGELRASADSPPPVPVQT